MKERRSPRIRVNVQRRRGRECLRKRRSGIKTTEMREKESRRNIKSKVGQGGEAKF
jgi:hypothetical protein